MGLQSIAHSSEESVNVSLVGTHETRQFEGVFVQVSKVFFQPLK